MRRIGPSEIDRVIQAVLAFQSGFDEAAQVVGARGRIDHRGKRGRVGRHHKLVAEAALQSEAGHAERFVLKSAQAIDDVVGRLRDSPRDALT